MWNFKDGYSMITAWREITKQDYHKQEALLYIIPSPCQLFISKILKGGCILTDTYNAARKFRSFLIEAISEILKKEGMTSNQKKIGSSKLYNTLLHDLQMKTLMKNGYYFL